MQVLVTGVAGFIGYHVAKALLDDAIDVVGIDSLTPYYDVTLKEARLEKLAAMEGFSFIKGDIAERALFDELRVHYPDVTHIVHLAAQPGVRAFLGQPEAYIGSNIHGQLQVLEYARGLDGKLVHLVYASSSSVYGGAEGAQFREDAALHTPLSFYGVTKRSGEMMAEQYAAQYGLPITGLRLFTSYGPYGRPDMAYYRFTQALYAGEEITLYHNGEMQRDFTYITDTVAGILAALHQPATGHRLFNLGNNTPETVRHLLSRLEELTGKQAITRMAERQEIEPLSTCADITRAEQELGFSPRTALNDGLAHFVAWFCAYHGVS